MNIPKRLKQRSTSTPGYFHTKPLMCLKTAADMLQQIYSIHGDVTTPSVIILKNLLGRILPYYLPHLKLGSSDSLQPVVSIFFRKPRCNRRSYARSPPYWHVHMCAKMLVFKGKIKLSWVQLTSRSDHVEAPAFKRTREMSVMWDIKKANTFFLPNLVISLNELKAGG